MFAKGTLAAAVVGALVASTYGCDQPKPKCAAGRGNFIGIYKHTGQGPAACAELKGEKLGFSTYNPQGKEGKPNLDIGSIAIQSESLGTLVDGATAAGVADPDKGHAPYAIGLFSTSEPEGDFCTVPTLSVATQSIPEIKGDPAHKIEAAPATSMTYAWSNVRIYVTPAALGTQFTADLLLTTDNVACGYKVTGMYPYVACDRPNPKDKKKPLTNEAACSPESDDDPSVICASPAECPSGKCEGGLCRCASSAECCDDKDVAKCEAAGQRCAPAPDGAPGVPTCRTGVPRPTGSGINPDFPTRCDPELLVCTLTSDVLPALK